MERLEIRIAPSEMPSRLRERADDPSSPRKLAMAVHGFLAANQPVLLGHVKIGYDRGHVRILVHPDAPPGTRLGVEAALGLESRGPRLDEGLPVRDIDVDASAFDVEVSGDFGGEMLQEGLRSQVKYYPVPEAEWFEICEGILSVQSDLIVFETEYEIMSDARSRRLGGHEFACAEVVAFGESRWWNVPCLRLATGECEYRYGWTANFIELALEFDIEEWLRTLAQICPAGERRHYRD
jgi:hypothetical protein